MEKLFKYAFNKNKKMVPSGENLESQRFSLTFHPVPAVVVRGDAQREI